MPGAQELVGRRRAILTRDAQGFPKFLLGVWLFSCHAVAIGRDLIA
jgi:hypothetical protein